MKLKIKFMLSSKTDGTIEYHLWHCASRTDEPELTAQPWFRVLNLHQGQSAYSGFSRRAGHVRREKSKICGFCQMHCHIL